MRVIFFYLVCLQVGVFGFEASIDEVGSLAHFSPMIPAGLEHHIIGNEKPKEGGWRANSSRPRKLYSNENNDGEPVATTELDGGSDYLLQLVADKDEHGGRVRFADIQIASNQDFFYQCDIPAAEGGCYWGHNYGPSICTEENCKPYGRYNPHLASRGDLMWRNVGSGLVYYKPCAYQWSSWEESPAPHDCYDGTESTRYRRYKRIKTRVFARYDQDVTAESPSDATWTECDETVGNHSFAEFKDEQYKLPKCATKWVNYTNWTGCPPCFSDGDWKTDAKFRHTETRSAQVQPGTPHFFNESNVFTRKCAQRHSEDLNAEEIKPCCNQYDTWNRWEACTEICDTGKQVSTRGLNTAGDSPADLQCTDTEHCGEGSPDGCDATTKTQRCNEMTCQQLDELIASAEESKKNLTEEIESRVRRLRMREFSNESAQNMVDLQRLDLLVLNWHTPVPDENDGTPFTEPEV